jgi:hypothetical protein
MVIQDLPDTGMFSVLAHTLLVEEKDFALHGRSGPIRLQEIQLALDFCLAPVWIIAKKQHTIDGFPDFAYGLQSKIESTALDIKYLHHEKLLFVVWYMVMVDPAQP